MYRPECQGTEPFSMPRDMKRQCRIYKENDDDSLAFSKSCSFDGSVMRNNRRYKLEYSIEPSDF